MLASNRMRSGFVLAALVALALAWGHLDRLAHGGSQAWLNAWQIALAVALAFALGAAWPGVASPDAADGASAARGARPVHDQPVHDRPVHDRDLRASLALGALLLGAAAFLASLPVEFFLRRSAEDGVGAVLMRCALHGGAVFLVVLVPSLFSSAASSRAGTRP